MSPQRKVLYKFHEFHIDLDNRLLLRDGKVVPISPKVFNTLLLLIRNSARVVTKDDLRQQVWPGVFTTDNNINVHISKVRKALGQSHNGHRCIETIEKQGYRFACEVSEVSSEGADPPPEQIRSAGDRDFLAAATSNNWAMALAGARASADTASKGRRLTRMVIMAASVVLLAASIARFILHVPEPPPLRALRAVPVTNNGRAKTHPIVTDGLRLYFSEVVDGNKLLFQVAVSGGEVDKIDVPFANTALLDISPDHTELLIGSQPTIENEMRLWVIKVTGGSPRPLGDLRGHAGTWSPDQRLIAYANGSRLYLADNDGGESRELVDVGSGLPYNLRWSPDGKLLRFEVRDAQNRSTSLWEVGADGAGLRPLLPGWNNPPAECCGNWTPDGKYFVFQATHNQMTNIWAISDRPGGLTSGGHKPVQITDGPMSFRSPVISKDGDTLFAIGEQRLGELARYDARARQWVGYLPGISADYLDFAGDGERIAYVTYPEGNLWVSKADGSDRRQLSFPPMRAYSPNWSPDGRQVAFTATSPGSPWKIHVISVGDDRCEHLMPGDENEYGPVWSPDGGMLAFWKGERSLGTTAIYLFDSKTRKVIKLPGSEGLYGPRWSPEGDYIAAMPDNAESIMLYDLKRQTWKELVRMNAGNPRWSRDGKYIYFRSFYHEDPAVFRVRVKDHKLERWAPLKDLRRASGIFGPWMGLAPDGSVLVLRDVGIQNVYSFDLRLP